MSSDRPNVLLVSIDSLRPDYCSFVSGEEPTTPFLDQLAEESTVYTNAISPSIWTLQVHGSIFTGLYPPEHGLYDKGQVIGDHPTFADILSEDGYDTQSFGRNGWLNTAEITRGFDHHYFEDPSHVRNGFDAMTDGLIDLSPSETVRGTRRFLRAGMEKAGSLAFRHTMKDSLAVDATRERIAKAGRSGQTADEPFCYLTHLNDVHILYNPSAPYHDKFGDHSLIERRRNVRYQKHVRENQGYVYAGEKEPDMDQVEIATDLYRGCISQADFLVKRLVDKLKAEGVYDDTILILFGDHGDHLGWNGLTSHQFSVADELIRVPLLIRDPTGTIESGRTDELAQLNDIYPTLLSLLGFEPPETRSVDLTSDQREAAYVYYRCSDTQVESVEDECDVSREQLPPRRQYAVWKSPEEKTIWYPNEDEYDGPAAADSELREQLRDHYASLEEVPLAGAETISADTEENLRSMGYL